MAWSIDPFLPCLGALCTLLILIHKYISKKSGSKKNIFPPGPPGLPVVGNLLDLGNAEELTPHRVFLKLKAQYGPVIGMRFGMQNTVVVQSADAAMELFKKCDIAFADRSVPDALTVDQYHHGSVAMGSYGHYLRNMRRIMSIEFLVHKRVNATMSLRQKSMENLIAQIKEEARKSNMEGGFGEIEVVKLIFYTAFHTIGQLMLSKEVMESKVDKAGEFLEAFRSFTAWLGKPNLADFFPVLKWVDPQGIRRNTNKYLEKLLGFVSEIVRERIKDRQQLGKGKQTNDLLDAMLDEANLSVRNITVAILEMFLAGTETTSSTIEWGIAELLRNPAAMNKIQDEMERVVGSTRMVTESDLGDLPYLQATVKEILRLYPVIPLLLPRKARTDTEFMGYTVPKDTRILINVWAIHRDPNIWSDPLSFKPERFLDAQVDFKGQHFELLPFGAGRRSCLGMTLGHRTVSLSIACLLQAFNWKLGPGQIPETMDMREMVGLSLHKSVPLKVIPTPRM